jgi:hypothetical protein
MWDMAQPTCSPLSRRVVVDGVLGGAPGGGDALALLCCALRRCCALALTLSAVTLTIAVAAQESTGNGWPNYRGYVAFSAATNGRRGVSGRHSVRRPS